MRKNSENETLVLFLHDPENAFKRLEDAINHPDAV